MFEPLGYFFYFSPFYSFQEDDSDVPLLRFSPDVAEASAPEFSPTKQFKPKVGLYQKRCYNR